MATPTDTPPQSAIAHTSTPRASPPPTEPRDTPSTRQPTITPTSIPSGTRIEPLIAAGWPLGWSPDSAWIVYRGHDSQDHLHHMSSGQKCSLAAAPQASMVSDYHPLWEWLADGRLLVVSPDRVVITEPCAAASQDITAAFPRKPTGIVSVNPERNVFVLYAEDDTAGSEETPEQSEIFLFDSSDGSVWALPPEVGGALTDYSWSPGSTTLTIIGLNDDYDLPNAHVWVIDVDSGQIVRTIDLVHRKPDTILYAPQWVSPNQFVIRETWDRGPLLVTMGGDVRKIVDDIFRMPRSGEECAAQGSNAVGCWFDNAENAAYGFRSDTGAHILWRPAQWMNETTPAASMLYHDERGETETLDPEDAHIVSPDGEWMLLLRPSGPNILSLRLRPVDPTGSPVRIVMEEAFGSKEFGSDLLDWSPDSQHFGVADHTERSVILYDVHDGSEIGRWYADGYILAPRTFMGDYDLRAFAIWSPDGRHLLVEGRESSEGPSAVFIITLP